jgi:ADP-ribose pyrophosphatase YjhB (NUDIX family)
MTYTYVTCPSCGKEFEVRRNPVPTVDIIIELPGRGIALIKRKNDPIGWAIPGGYVDYGESLEEAAKREAKEEVGLVVTLKRQLHTYSHPSRDARQHTITTVYIATAAGIPEAGDDAHSVGIFTEATLPAPLVFDHAQILRNYFKKST